MSRECGDPSKSSSPVFAIAVAGITPGVGKSTIALNLAIYLKAFREDLPVTLISLDPHFNVADFLSISGEGLCGGGDLFSGSSFAEAAHLGQYGVQFLAGENGGDFYSIERGELRRTLTRSSAEGILIFDTASGLQDATRRVLEACNLVLAPLCGHRPWRDLSVLVAAAREAGLQREALWLLPNQVEAQTPGGGDAGWQEYLASYAEEFGFPVTPLALEHAFDLAENTSPANPFCSVMHRLPAGPFQRGFRELAAFVLDRYDRPKEVANGKPPGTRRQELLSRTRAARFQPQCPWCGLDTDESARLWYWEDTARRRHGFIHHSCMEELAENVGVDLSVLDSNLLALTKNEPGWSPGLVLSLQALDEEGAPETCHAVPGDAEMARVFSNMTGRLMQELPAVRIFLADGGERPEAFLTARGYRDFCRLRRQFRQWTRG
ncbi:ParA family protein [Geoalkalibacter subterraneus]|uniref:CobQ/CobB/MinD/ParA nucleotide binding domain-containing protein n=1 Tax=Geoalkalibacter subterraneus TaxID=483547 RepID=A0A0B5FRG5_9BACT|nr:ParA family protein [Geoalkalibacter subterraneus]AJF06161.1 hypothetical protein GSUB_05720 [Geoalkalibacter subterraneus]